jgi:hypothetical protein
MSAEISHFLSGDQEGFCKKMQNRTKKKIVSLLGVGFDTDDGHIRITKGDRYDVLMGSEESHEYIQQLIQKIENELDGQGLSLEDFTPEEFGEFIRSTL